MERPLSVSRKVSNEERDPDEMACRVHQAIQRENEPVRSPEPFGRSTVCLPDSLNISMTHSVHCYKEVFFFFALFFYKVATDA